MSPTFLELLKTRIRDLELPRGKLARSLGYTNVPKGCRRIDAIRAGDIPSGRMIDKLDNALWLSAAKVDLRFLMEASPLCSGVPISCVWRRGNEIALTLRMGRSARRACIFRQWCGGLDYAAVARRAPGDATVRPAGERSDALIDEVAGGSRREARADAEQGVERRGGVAASVPAEDVLVEIAAQVLSAQPWKVPSAHRFRFEKTRWVHFSTTWAAMRPTVLASWTWSGSPM